MTAADVYETFPATFYFASAANSSGDISVPPRASLTLVVYSQGMNVADTAKLVFNADVNAKYTCTYISVAGGLITPTNTNSTAQTGAIFSPSQSTGFLAVFSIANIPGQSKPFSYQLANVTASGTTPGTQIGGGEWVNTAGPISSVRLTAPTNNFLAGSWFACFAGDGL